MIRPATIVQQPDGPWTVDITNPCGCGDTLYVWARCEANLGDPSPTSYSLDIICDCCPVISLDTPTVTGAAPNAIATFALSAPVSWSPPGCTPPVSITGYKWTVKQGTTQYELTTSTPNARTDSGNWIITGTNTSAPLPLPLTAGSWDVKVRPTFSAGTLSANCNTSDSTSFNVSATPLPQCCPTDRSAPNGVSVAVTPSSAAPNVSDNLGTWAICCSRCEYEHLEHFRRCCWVFHGLDGRVSQVTSGSGFAH